ncbi:MAG: hypothetical protein ABR955_15335, partial [Verrucomicrobiota bacterium]
MKKILAIAISIIGFEIAANAQVLLYEWAFTNATDTPSNSAVTFATTPGTGNLIMQNVSGNIFGTIGNDAINPVEYLTNANFGPVYTNGVKLGALVANGDGYSGGNTAVAIATNLNLGTLYQFTVTFWALMGSSVNGQFPRFVEFGAENNYDAGGKGPTANGVGTSINTAPSGYPCFQNGLGNASLSQNDVMSVTNALVNGLP